MNQQQKLEASLMQTFTRILVVVMILGLVAIGIKRMLPNLQTFHNENLKQEVLRLKHVIQVLHNQWLIKGKPQTIQVEWTQLAEYFDKPSIEQVQPLTEIPFNTLGFPKLATLDDQGCELLWQTLMAVDSKLLNIKAEYKEQTHECHFYQQVTTEEKQPLGEIRYQLKTGQADYLELKTE